MPIGGAFSIFVSCQRGSRKDTDLLVEYTTMDGGGAESVTVHFSLLSKYSHAGWLTLQGFNDWSSHQSPLLGVVVVKMKDEG